MSREGGIGPRQLQRASMRPGQAAPDERRTLNLIDMQLGASMRPGQAAPDECVEIVEGVDYLVASMRPGQAAPDESATTDVSRASMQLQ